MKAYKTEGINKIGIDPTGKQFEHFYTRDIKLISDFFNEANFRRVFPEKNAKVITSLAMFYDLEKPMEFIKQVKSCLDSEGIWVFEQSYMPLMLERDSFDTICHEHLEYYSFKVIYDLLKGADLRIINLQLHTRRTGCPSARTPSISSWTRQ